MTPQEFEREWAYLEANCAPLQVDHREGRREAFVEHFAALTQADFRAGANLYLKTTDHPYFPAVSEMFAALREVADLGEPIRNTLDPDLRADLARRRNDPIFRKRREEEDRKALDAAFQSPEHKALLDTMRQPDSMSLRGGSLRKQ